MSIFLISYDLKKEKNYPELWDEMKRVEGQKILASVYLTNLQTDSSTVVRDWLRDFVDQDDKVIVVKIKLKDLKFIMANQGTNAWLEANQEVLV